MKIATPIIATALAVGCAKPPETAVLDPWCGDELCLWHLERGEVAAVPTWAPNDLGVDFVGSDVAIDQVVLLSAGAYDSRHPLPEGPNCVTLDLVAEIDADAAMSFNLDVFADGTIDSTQRLPTSAWTQVSLETTIDGWFQGLRLELTKQGSGRAVLAALSVEQLPRSCGGSAPQIVAPPAPLGSTCSGSSCASGATCEVFGTEELGENVSVCEGCVRDADCGSGDVCGAGTPASAALDIPRECVPAGRALLGEPCWTARECATGICTSDGQYATAPGVCSGCSSDADCGSSGVSDGYRCRGGVAPPSILQPEVCEPGSGMAGSGAWCLGGSDCASGVCDGTMIQQCEGDYRACTSDEDCGAASFPSSHPCMPALVGGTCR